MNRTMNDISEDERDSVGDAFGPRAAQPEPQSGDHHGPTFRKVEVAADARRRAIEAARETEGAK